MSKRVYVGVSNVARRAKKIYVGVDGKARKVKKAWVGVGNVARQFYSAGFEFSYTGSGRFASGSSLEGNWCYICTGSGTLNLTSVDGTVDIFLCGGGYDGGYGSFNSNDSGQMTSYGGDGGAGGKRSTYTGITLPEGSYTVTIGSRGGNSSIGSYSSSGGSSSSGGHGAALSDAGLSYHAAAGDAGAYAFGDSSIDGILWGAGGGGGATRWGSTYGTQASGGSSGGGSGGDCSDGSTVTSATNGSYGGGGGGAGRDYTNTTNAGTGGSGCVIIRNHR